MTRIYARIYARIYRLLLWALVFPLSQGRAEEAPVFGSFDEYPVYSGSDLGVRYTPERSVCKLWAPSASAVKLHLYDAGLGGQKLSERRMARAEAGVWEVILEGDQEGNFYTFETLVGGRWGEEVPDPYAVATGVNGRRGMIVDLDALVPKGWDNDRRPILRNSTDIVLYELHIRDLSTHPAAGISNAGKFLGLTEIGTRSPQGMATGLAHIKELGVTHVHLLPVFDYSYRSVDETRLDEPQFNWGYDPQNYNVPEGSYATDPYDGRVRIREFREMVKAMHDNGLRVVMDVVYNHTGFTERSLFNQLVPGYYYRQRLDGKLFGCIRMWKRNRLGPRHGS